MTRLGDYCPYLHPISILILMETILSYPPNFSSVFNQVLDEKKVNNNIGLKTEVELDIIKKYLINERVT